MLRERMGCAGGRSADAARLRAPDLDRRASACRGARRGLRALPAADPPPHPVRVLSPATRSPASSGQNTATPRKSPDAWVLQQALGKRSAAAKQRRCARYDARWFQPVRARASGPNPFVAVEAGQIAFESGLIPRAGAFGFSEALGR